MDKTESREKLTSEEIRKILCLSMDEANCISSVICETFHKKNIDIGWAFKKEPPCFCGMIAEILDIEDTDKETFIKLRVRRLGASEVAKPLAYCVVSGKVTKDL